MDLEKDQYAIHRGHLVEVGIGQTRHFGVYCGLSRESQDVILYPSLAWITNNQGEPLLKMNDERPREINLRSVDYIGPVSKSYVEFYTKECLRQFRKERSKSGEQSQEQQNILLR